MLTHSKDFFKQSKTIIDFYLWLKRYLKNIGGKCFQKLFVSWIFLSFSNCNAVFLSSCSKICKVELYLKNTCVEINRNFARLHVYSTRYYSELMTTWQQMGLSTNIITQDKWWRTCVGNLVGK